MIHPTPALLVRADTSIEECVRHMNRHGVGSVLVTQDRAEGELVGIFTERDLLRRAELIQKKGFWGRPVRTVMSCPVRTIDLSELDGAAAVMLEAGIRHLPVTARGEDGKIRLAGVISMRDILRAAIRGPAAAEAPTSDAGVLSVDRGLLAAIGNTLAVRAGRRSIRTVASPGEILSAPGYRPGAVSHLVLDVDGLAPKEWAELLRAINRAADAPRVVVAYDPVKHAQAEIAVLEEVGASGRFAVFAKPVNLLELSAAISA